MSQLQLYFQQNNSNNSNHDRQHYHNHHHHKALRPPNFRTRSLMTAAQQHLISALKNPPSRRSIEFSGRTWQKQSTIFKYVLVHALAHKNKNCCGFVSSQNEPFVSTYGGGLLPWSQWTVMLLQLPQTDGSREVVFYIFHHIAILPVSYVLYLYRLNN